MGQRAPALGMGVGTAWPLPHRLPSCALSSSTLKDSPRLSHPYCSLSWVLRSRKGGWSQVHVWSVAGQSSSVFDSPRVPYPCGCTAGPAAAHAVTLRAIPKGVFSGWTAWKKASIPQRTEFISKCKAERACWGRGFCPHLQAISQASRCRHSPRCHP